MYTKGYVHRVIIIPSKIPVMDCIGVCCLRIVLDQITRIQAITTGNAAHPNTKNSAVPGPPIPAPCTDTFDFRLAIVTPLVTVKYAAARALITMQSSNV